MTDQPAPPSEFAQMIERAERLLASAFLTFAGSFDHAQELLLEAAGIGPEPEPKSTREK